MRTFMLILLFFFLITKNGSPFTFRICRDNDNYDCLDTIFTEESFTSQIINDYYFQNVDNKRVYINAANETEIAINADDFISEVQIRFINIQENTRLYIQTNKTEYKYKYSTPSYYPSIYADDLDVIVENLNNNNKNKTLFCCYYLSVKSISPKDQNMPLFLYLYMHTKELSINSIKPPVFHTFSGKFILDDHLDESKELIFSMFNPTDSALSSYFYLKFSVYADLNITFGKREIRFVYPDGITLTLKYEFKTRIMDIQIFFYDHALISVDEGLYEDDLVFASLYNNNNNFNDQNGEKTPEIIGNWPEMKKLVEEKTLYDQTLNNKFIYSANNYPTYGFSELVLTKKVSSIYFLSQGCPYPSQTTLMNDEETIFIINGKTISSSYQDNDFTGNPKLTIVFNSKIKINYINKTKNVYQLIDNSVLSFNDAVLDFQKGGIVKTPFGIDYKDFYKEVKTLHESYQKDHQDQKPGSESSLNEKYNYFFEFVRNKISDLSDLINTKIKNKGIPITINPIDILNKGDKVSTIILNRYDFLVTSTYKSLLNKATNILCAETGTLDASKWKVKLGTDLYVIFSPKPEVYTKYVPHISSTDFLFDVVSTENGRCIGIKPTDLPKRGIEFIFYTTNETYLEILQKIDLFVTLTSSDLDAFSKLKDVNSKNYVVLVLDDLPENKAINLKGIPRDSKVFLLGFRTESLQLILDCIDIYENLNWKEENCLAKLAEYLNKHAAKYTEYQVKASVTCDAIYTLFLGLINYSGTQVKCTMFYALLCSFSYLKKLSSKFSAQVTWTDSITYQEMSILTFRDLLILPVTMNPPNIFGVEQIDFTSSKYTLHMKGGLYDTKGYYTDESKTMTIDAKKIRGILMVYSATKNCVMTVLDNVSDQKIKGLSFMYFDIKDIKDIEYMVILEDSFPEMNFRKSKDPTMISFAGNWDKVKEIEGKIEINTGTKPVVIEKVPHVVASVLDVKSDDDIKISMSSSASERSVIKFSQQLLISSSKMISFDDANTDVSFADIRFTDSLPSLSLKLGKDQARIVADRVEVDSSTAAVVNGDLEILEELQIGPGGSIEADRISASRPQLVLCYRLSERFGNVPDSIDPSSIVLRYIGESSNADTVSDYEPYLGKTNAIKTFEGEKHFAQCEEWRGKTSFESVQYPEFSGAGKLVDILCIKSDAESSLVINLTAIPEGLTNEPTIDLEFPSFDYEPNDPNPDMPVDETSSRNENNENINSESHWGNDGNEGGSNWGNNGNEDGSGSESGSNKNDKKLPTAAIVGIVVGVVVVIAVACVLVWLFVIRKPKNNEEKEIKQVNGYKQEIIKKEDSNAEDSDIYFSVGIIEDVE